MFKEIKELAKTINAYIQEDDLNYFEMKQTDKQVEIRFTFETRALIGIDDLGPGIKTTEGTVVDGVNEIVEEALEKEPSYVWEGPQPEDQRKNREKIKKESADRFFSKKKTASTSYLRSKKEGKETVIQTYERLMRENNSTVPYGTWKARVDRQKMNPTEAMYAKDKRLKN